MQSWKEAPLTDLIDHILKDYHRPLDSELPRLEALARKVLLEDGENAPELLDVLLEVYVDLKDELESHMAKEERVLFPMIKSGGGSTTTGPISVMEHEHESANWALRRLRELTDDYSVPDGASEDWRNLWLGLAALEQAIHRHIELENSVLFPRALAR